MNNNSDLMLYYAVFDGEQSANQAMGVVFDKNTGEVKTEDVVVVAQDANGKTKVLQTKELNKSMGVLAGSAMGLLGGVLLSIPIFGLGVGAVVGLRKARKTKDLGIDNQFLSTVGEALYPNSSAILMLIDQDEIAVVEDKLKQLNPKEYKQELSQETIEKLKQMVKD